MRIYRYAIDATIIIHLIGNIVSPFMRNAFACVVLTVRRSEIFAIIKVRQQINIHSCVDKSISFNRSGSNADYNNGNCERWPMVNAKKKIYWERVFHLLLVHEEWGVRNHEKNWLKHHRIRHTMKYDCTRTMATITGMRTSVMFNWSQLYFGAFLKAQQYALYTVHGTRTQWNHGNPMEQRNVTQNNTQSKQLHFHRLVTNCKKTRILHAIFSLWSCWTFPISLTFNFYFYFRIIHEPNSNHTAPAIKNIICHVSLMKMVFKNSCKSILCIIWFTYYISLCSCDRWICKTGYIGSQWKFQYHRSKISGQLIIDVRFFGQT